MPTVQSNYPENIPAAYEGMAANMVPATFISRSVEDAAGIGFGVPVTQGTEDYQCAAFSGSGSVLGVTVRDRSLDANDPDSFAENDTARVLTQGAIWVTAAVAVNAGDDVYVTDAGAFTNESLGNTQIADARFDTSTSGEALAVVRIQ